MTPYNLLFMQLTLTLYIWSAPHARTFRAPRARTPAMRARVLVMPAMYKVIIALFIASRWGLLGIGGTAGGQWGVVRVHECEGLTSKKYFVQKPYLEGPGSL